MLPVALWVVLPPRLVCVYPQRVATRRCLTQILAPCRERKDFAFLSTSNSIRHTTTSLFTDTDVQSYVPVATSDLTLPIACILRLIGHTNRVTLRGYLGDAVQSSKNRHTHSYQHPTRASSRLPTRQICRIRVFLRKCSPTSSSFLVYAQQVPPGALCTKEILYPDGAWNQMVLTPAMSHCQTRSGTTKPKHRKER